MIEGLADRRSRHLLQQLFGDRFKTLLDDIDADCVVQVVW